MLVTIKLSATCDDARRNNAQIQDAESEKQQLISISDHSGWCITGFSDRVSEMGFRTGLGSDRVLFSRNNGNCRYLAFASLVS